MRVTSCVFCDGPSPVQVQKVVSTWKFEKDGVDIPMLDIAHDHKAGQLEQRDTFVSLDANRLCRWDMRDKRGVVQTSDDAATPQGLGWADGKDYSRGTNFTCMATSGSGFVAVGSRDGKIRLYPGAKMDRAAMTSIPGLGAPITAIDVTYDGEQRAAPHECFGACPS